jgi:hypothetical protein
MAGLLHRTAQPPTLAAFLPWEGSAGAGRVRPATANIVHEFKIQEMLNDKINYCFPNLELTVATPSNASYLSPSDL